MNSRKVLNIIIGGGVFLFGLYILLLGGSGHGIVPILIGGSLLYMGFRGGRAAMVFFGHMMIVAGAYLITLGIYLLPYSEPTVRDVFTRPLFWGIISVFGGICSIYHGFCRCVLSGTCRQEDKKEDAVE